jgi:hypothetical protein
MVAMRRDINERLKLDEFSIDIPGPIINLTDGTLELWGAKGDDPQAYANFVDQYLGVLSRLYERGVVTAGYVEKPSANLVISLLEIATADEENLRRLRNYHPLHGVTDRWLYGETDGPLLPPGHRSAVFGLQSGSEKKYKEGLSLHFFYLNVGTEGHPYPVRVEIPRWVAEDSKKLDLLHGVLIEQCKIMGSRPYPYLLHRAHEVAVIRFDEANYLEELILAELAADGVTVEGKSAKQSGKDAGSRRRYAG